MKFQAKYYKEKIGVSVFFPKLKIFTSGMDLNHARQMALELLKYYQLGEIKPMSKAQQEEFRWAEEIAIEWLEV